ncbi:MAG: hypothetical protein HY744_02410 [Deltaproteobacteria bacterium]|nr:hypothetical protein [Deltaproteobacteria bacterium]
MRKLSLFLALALGLFALTPSPYLQAKPKPRKTEVAAEPAKIETPVAISPAALRWSMKSQEVYDVYGADIDEDYLQKRQEAQPGVQTKELENEIQEVKFAFWQSRMSFGDTATKYDGTKLRPEYSYRNGEMLMSIVRQGKTRYLFFIKDRLWKIIDVYKLGEKSKFGPDYKTAIDKLTKLMVVPGRARKADPKKEPPNDEADWADGKTHVRAADWGTELAVVYEHIETVGRLAQLRTAKQDLEENEITPSTKDYIRP